MGTISLGNFGTSTIEVAPQARTDVIGEAVANVGGQIEQVGAQMAQRRSQEQAAQASNNLLDHQLQIQQLQQKIGDGLATGQITPEDARAQYDAEAAKLQPPQVLHLTPEAAGAYERGAQRVQTEGAFRIDTLVDVAKRQRYKDQFTDGLDKLGKLAGSPGTTPEQVQAIIDQAKTFGPVGRNAGVPAPEVDQAIQNFADQTWLNNAVNRAITSSDDMTGLNALKEDLTKKGGFYDGKLDTNKRNAVLAQVQNRIDVLHNRLEHAADKRDADGLRAMNEINQQISSTVPATPDQWANWAQRTQGTSSSADFADAVKHEQEVQGVLRLPIDQQLAYLQSKQAQLDKNGGSIKDQANLFRLGTAVQKNAIQMQQAPLQYLANRIGTDVPPLDITQIIQPGGIDALGKQVSQRVLDLQAMRKQYGPQVQMRPLLKQEADQLGSVVENATPTQAAQVFSGLRQIAGTDDAYAGMMQQIAPDHPVLALAGLRAQQDPKVAATIVQGESMLNATKAAKAADGKPSVNLYLPDDKLFQGQFADQVGTTFRNHPQAAETAYQAVKAYYVGKAIHDGKVLDATNAPDSRLLKEAVDSVVGTIVDYNGKGEVAAPWGMDKGTFNSRVDLAWQAAVKKFGVELSGAQVSQLGLTNTEQEGVYAVTSGNNYLTTTKGVPIVLNLNDPAVLNAPPKVSAMGALDPRISKYLPK